MPERSPNTLVVTRKLLRLLIGVNIIFGVGILALLVASIVAPIPVFTALGIRPPAAIGPMIVGMRMIMVIGISSIPFAHVVLTRLLAIVDTVSVGDPFVHENAARLTTIARAVLGLEVTHLIIGLVAAGAFSAGQAIDIGWSFSLTRWLAILLLFVLARVFEQGARMREDLEGTV